MSVYEITIFGISLKINPVAFTIPLFGGWDIYWYGIIIALGFLLCLIYAYKKAALYGIDTDRMVDVVLVTTPLSILCARAYYVIFDGQEISSVKEFFGFDSSGFSGLAIYGGVIGAIVIGGIMCKIRKVNMPDMYDLALTCFLLAQGIGRWGNFFNQEAYGTFTGSKFWGMESTRTIAEMGPGPVHPCFLYESIWCIAGFFLLNYIGKKRKYSGQVSLCYGVWYGFGRAVIETIRTDSLMLGNIRVSCLLSAVLCLICGAFLIANRIKGKNTAKDGEYKRVFDIADSSETDTEKAEEQTEKEQ